MTAPVISCETFETSKRRTPWDREQWRAVEGEPIRQTADGKEGRGRKGGRPCLGHPKSKRSEGFCSRTRCKTRRNLSFWIFNQPMRVSSTNKIHYTQLGRRCHFPRYPGGFEIPSYQRPVSSIRGSRATTKTTKHNTFKKKREKNGQKNHWGRKKEHRKQNTENHMQNKGQQQKF